MTRRDVATTREIDAEVFAEEVAWLRSFGLGDEKIADRLRMTLSTFQRRLERGTSSARCTSIDKDTTQ